MDRRAHQAGRTGGILIITLHGDNYIGKLLPDERRTYSNGNLVIRGQAVEGKRCFTAFQSPAYVRKTLAAALEELEHLEGDQGAQIQQDIWVFRKRP